MSREWGVGWTTENTSRFSITQFANGLRSTRGSGKNRAETAYQPLVVLLAAFAAGIVADRYGPQAELLWWSASTLLALFWLFAWQRAHYRFAAALLLLACALAGSAWHHVCWRPLSRDEIGRFARETAAPACITAIIASPPERVPAPRYSPLRGRPLGDETRCTVRVTGIRNGAAWRRAEGRALLAVEGHLVGFSVGDRVEVFAFLSTPGDPLNPGEFNFREHERADRTLARLRATTPDAIQLTTQGSPWNPENWIGRARTQGRRLLAYYIPPERTDLAAALLLGLREPLPFEETEAYLKTGTIHLLSISGLHVAALAGFFLLAARSGLLPRAATFLAVALLTAAYALLADANPPVVRATVLVSLVCLAAILGRRTLSFNSLAAAALVVLALSPADLFRVGTQLSFLAVATLAACRHWLVPPAPSDALARLIATTRPWPVRAFRSTCFWMGRLWLASLLIWLVSLPLVMRQYHLVSPVATLINPLIGLPAALALVAGFGVLVCGWIAPLLADLCGWLCDINLAFMERLVESAQHWPLAYWWVAEPAGWWVLGFYALLGAYAAFPNCRPPRRWSMALAAFWLAVGLFSTVPGDRLTGHSRHTLAGTFVAVGHGTSMLLELPDGRTLLYDCGGPTPTSTTRHVMSVLYSRGLTHLDAVIVSHADIDHFNGLPGVLQRVSVGAIYVSPVMFRGNPPAVLELREAITAAGVPLRELSAGDRLAVGDDLRVEVLHPLASSVHGNDNANSIVLQIEYAGRRLLLPGDLETPGLEQLLAEEPRKAHVAMAPHHGSAHSNPQGFVAWARPDFVVISGGRGEIHGPVKAAYEQFGAGVWHTAEVGAVRVELSATAVNVHPFRAANAAPRERSSAAR